MQTVDLRLGQLKSDLESFLTKYKKDDLGFGSIEEKYGMTPKEVDIVFRHPKLKDLETPFRFKLIDDIDDAIDNPISHIEQVSSNLAVTAIPAPYKEFDNQIPDDVNYVQSERMVASSEIELHVIQQSNLAESELDVSTMPPPVEQSSKRVMYEDQNHDMLGLL